MDWWHWQGQQEQTWTPGFLTHKENPELFLEFCTSVSAVLGTPGRATEGTPGASQLTHPDAQGQWGLLSLAAFSPWRKPAGRFTCTYTH